MGTVLDILLGGSETLDDKQYESLDYRNAELNPESALEIKTAEVNTKSDLLKVENAIRSGNIVISNVRNLGAGIDKDDVVSFLESTVDDVDGDIVWRDENELITAPRGVEISRQSLT